MNSDNPIEYYSKYISHFERLSKIREIELSNLLRNESSKIMARNELIEGNFKLVLSCANKYYSLFNYTIPLQDLIEYGNFGLIDAATRFDHNKGSFSTFATLRINSRISRFVDERDLVHVPENHKYMLRKAKRDYKDIDEFIKSNNMSEYMIGMLKNNISNKIVHIDGMESFDIMDDREIKQNNDDVIEILDSYIDRLPEQEKSVLKLFYYKNMNATEIGRKFGVTRQRIEKICEKGLIKLRNRLLSRKHELVE